MSESEGTEEAEVEASESEEEAPDYEAMYTASQDELGRARAIISHYGGEDIDIDTELRFAVPDAEGAFMYRPAAPAPTAETPTAKPAVRPRSKQPSRPQAPAPKSIADLSDDEYQAWKRKPENQFVKTDYGEQIWQ